MVGAPLASSSIGSPLRVRKARCSSRAVFEAMALHRRAQVRSTDPRIQPSVRSRDGGLVEIRRASARRPVVRSGDLGRGTARRCRSRDRGVPTDPVVPRQRQPSVTESTSETPALRACEIRQSPGCSGTASRADAPGLPLGGLRLGGSRRPRAHCSAPRIELDHRGEGARCLPPSRGSSMQHDVADAGGRKREEPGGDLPPACRRACPSARAGAVRSRAGRSPRQCGRALSASRRPWRTRRRDGRTAPRDRSTPGCQAVTKRHRPSGRPGASSAAGRRRSRWAARPAAACGRSSHARAA